MALKRTKSSAEDKHQIFVEEYLKTLNATQAALAAGYKGNNVRNTAYDLLHHPDIAPLIEEGLKRRSEQCKVDTQFVIEQAKALVLDPKTPAKDKAKALDLLGRYTGAWSGAGGDVKQTTTIEVRLTD